MIYRYSCAVSNRNFETFVTDCMCVLSVVPVKCIYSARRPSMSSVASSGPEEVDSLASSLNSPAPVVVGKSHKIYIIPCSCFSMWYFTD